MVLSNVELYEALKGPIGPEAARMIAEVVPPAQELATKRDLTEGLAELKSMMAQLESRIMGRLWVMFVPLWVGLYGLITTLLVRG